MGARLEDPADLRLSGRLARRGGGRARRRRLPTLGPGHRRGLCRPDRRADRPRHLRCQSERHLEQRQDDRQKLAASAWGSPRTGRCPASDPCGRPRMRSRTSRRRAAEPCSILDEVAHADGRAVSRMIYSIASGIGKARQNAQSALRARCSWQTFVILSSECGLEAKIRGDGGAWLAGMAVRVADIDVTGVNRAVTQATLDAISRHREALRSRRARLRARTHPRRLSSQPGASSPRGQSRCAASREGGHRHEDPRGHSVRLSCSWQASSRGRSM